jgi:phosphoenolpyruvate synthase/pyruvate phosphate dikinase
LERLSEGENNSFVLLTEIGKRIGVSAFDLIYLRSAEIVNYLKTNQKVSKSIIDERQLPFGMISYNKKTDFYFGTDYKKLVSKLKLQKIKSTNVRGQVAYPGMVKGTACIVKTDEELKKLKKGQVLIAKMTTPDYIFAMQMSAAVVTDFGGVTSHASVVSRELAKPCVIGTGNGTSVFKDGDLVEVDANKGIVRKVKSQK